LLVNVNQKSFKFFAYFLSYTSTSQQKIDFVSKNDTDVTDYNFNTLKPMLVILGRDVAERVLSNGDLLFCELLVTLDF